MPNLYESPKASVDLPARSGTKSSIFQPSTPIAQVKQNITKKSSEKPIVSINKHYASPSLRYSTESEIPEEYDSAEDDEINETYEQQDELQVTLAQYNFLLTKATF